MGADEQPSPTRKRDREEEELADGGAAEKRPRAEGASLLGLASYEDDDEEEAARGHGNGRRAEEQNGMEDEDDDDEEDVRRAPEWRPRQVELRRDCPYLDTVNRQVLDFDCEKFCSISLSNLNVYACLVCGKYFQGRGLKSHAYTHSLEAGHHVFINLQTEKAYCLPDGYEINDPSLEDIRHVLNPRFAKEQVLNLDKNKQWSRALDGSNYLPGMDLPRRTPTVRDTYPIHRDRAFALAREILQRVHYEANLQLERMEAGVQLTQQELIATFSRFREWTSKFIQMTSCHGNADAAVPPRHGYRALASLPWPAEPPSTSTTRPPSAPVYTPSTSTPRPPTAPAYSYSAVLPQYSGEFGGGSSSREHDIDIGRYSAANYDESLEHEVAAHLDQYARHSPRS